MKLKNNRCKLPLLRDIKAIFLCNIKTWIRYQWLIILLSIISSNNKYNNSSHNPKNLISFLLLSSNSNNMLLFLLKLEIINILNNSTITIVNSSLFNKNKPLLFMRKLWMISFVRLPCFSYLNVKTVSKELKYLRIYSKLIKVSYFTYSIQYYIIAEAMK